MDILVDGHPLSVEFTDADPVSSVLSLIHSHLHGQKRLVTKVCLDGKEVLPSEEDQVASHACADHQRLEVTTETSEGMCLQTLTEVRNLLRELSEAHRRAAEFLHRGELSTSFQALTLCVKGWQALIRGIRILHTLIRIGVVGISISDAQEKELTRTNRALRDLLKAVDQQDFARLGDLLEYELVECLGFWDRWVESLHRQMQGGGNGH